MGRENDVGERSTSGAPRVRHRPPIVEGAVLPSAAPSFPNRVAMVAVFLARATTASVHAVATVPNAFVQVIEPFGALEPSFAVGGPVVDFFPPVETGFEALLDDPRVVGIPIDAVGRFGVEIRLFVDAGLFPVSTDHIGKFLCEGRSIEDRPDVGR